MEKPNQYVFALEEQFINTLQLLEFDESLSLVGVANGKAAFPPSTEAPKVVGARTCTSCNLDLGSELLQKETAQHYKSDFHRLNLKRALNDLPPLTENEFDELLESQSLESISGSEDSDLDSDDELPTIFEKLSARDTAQDDHEEQSVSHMNTRSPFIILGQSGSDGKHGLGVYKSLFSPEVLQQGTVLDSLRSYNSPASRAGKSVLLMIGGGHFAGAVIAHQRSTHKANAKNHKESMQAQRVVVLESKTFHRYTTRRKQGGSQSASDNARGKANSAGSSIRRYNEQALKKDVHELLVLWKAHLDEAQHVFIRANGAANRKHLVGYEDAILKQNDPRIKSFPFTTKRATMGEVKNAWVKLTHLTEIALTKATPSPAPEPKPSIDTAKSRTIEKPQLLELDVHTAEIVPLLKKSRAPLLVSYMKKHGLDANFAFTPTDQFGHTPTALHYASSQGLQHMVKVLLLNMKADPTLQNVTGKVAAQLSASSQVKSTFQVCRASLGEDYCDWARAKVGPPRTAEEVSAAEEEARRAQLELTRKQIAEELAQKTELELRQPKFSSGGRVGGSTSGTSNTVQTKINDMSGLTDQQKMRIMREQRALAAEARMRKN